VTPPPVTPPASPYFLCTSPDRSTGTCSSIGCDSSGCASGLSCSTNVLNRQGANC
jgi:hypothetical protein